MLSWIRYGIEEMKFLRSYGDLKIFYNQKLPFFISRITKNPIKETDVPPSLQLEPTNRCNLDCISCSRDKACRKMGYMDFDLFRKIIDDASGIGVQRVHLYLHGESMLHPRIIDMIGYIKSMGLGLTMATNGMLFDKDALEAILRSGVNSSDYFIFSILGYSKEVHERVMRGVDHERVESNLLEFLRLRKLHKVNGPVIETVFYRMAENEHEAEQFKVKWQGVVDHVHPVGDVARQFVDPESGAGSLPPRNKTCNNLWERMTVFWNGDVTRCIADINGEHVYGNLRDQSIRDVWNCEEMLSVKRIHREERFGDLDLCSNCDW